MSQTTSLNHISTKSTSSFIYPSFGDKYAEGERKQDGLNLIIPPRHVQLSDVYANLTRGNSLVLYLGLLCLCKTSSASLNFEACTIPGCFPVGIHSGLC